MLLNKFISEMWTNRFEEVSLEMPLVLGRDNGKDECRKILEEA